MILLFVFCLIPGVFSSSSFFSFFNGRSQGGYNNRHYEKANMNNSSFSTSSSGPNWVTQPLDHFDTNNTKIWKQRYFYNPGTQDDSNVSLLYISGEEQAAEWMVWSGAQAEYAMQLNASIYVLEHRFYGESRPTEDTSTDNLKYLSSRQAVEDIAEFIRQKNAENGGAHKWIVVGGSYAGELAAWSRLKHPELISGALSSSASLLRVMDFYGYFQVVDEQLKKTDKVCYEKIGNGFREAQRLFQSEDGRENLTNIFKIDPPLSQYEDITDNDRQLFFSTITVAFKESVQYNHPPPAELCKKFIIHENPLEALQSLHDSPVSTNFTKTVDELRNVDFDDDNVNWRLFIYQMCSEFGLFQTTNRGTNLFGQIISSNFWIDICIDLFDIDADEIEKNVEETNEYYGGRDYYDGTNVVFSRGSQDPWSFLAMKENPKHWSVVLVEIEGGSHCSDLDVGCFSTAICDEKMAKTQRLVLQNMKRWIDPIFPVPDKVEITDDVGKSPQLSNSFVALPPILQTSSNPTNRAKRSMEIARVGKGTGFNTFNSYTGRRSMVMLPSPDTESKSSNELTNETMRGKDWIDQSWDHFNPNEERTFKQKWFFNYEFGSASGPNFLDIGGEGPLGSGPSMIYAKEVGANVYALEHRYYGESKLGTNDLQFLTSAQAMYDIATFIRTQQVKGNRTGPWITIGGSYAGALSAWSRQWFPDLIVGAVSSSAPLQAKNDFYEYMEVVEDVINRTSPACYDRIGEAFDRIRMLSNNPEGRMIIQEKFKLSPAWKLDESVDPLDLSQVFLELFEKYTDAVQYNSNNWTDSKTICDIIENDQYGDPLDALRAVQELRKGENITTQSSFENELQKMIDQKDYIDGHNSSVNSEDDMSNVLWVWQTCNEFGYYQTTDYGRGIFGTALSLNYFITVCERVYGIGMDHVERAIERANYMYGGSRRFNATNIVLTNGDADPWHVLGILERGNLDESVVPILIKDASHCKDLYPTTTDDTPQLTQARKTTLENIKKWIASASASSATQTLRPIEEETVRLLKL